MTSFCIKGVWRRAAGLALLLGCCVAGGGCASPGMWADRAYDAADVVTATVGLGSGGKVRAGPLQIALIKTSDIAGLRAGQWFVGGLDLLHNEELYVLPFPLPGMRTQYWWVLPYGAEGFSHGVGSRSRRRGKDIAAQSPFPCLVFSGDPAFYTQLELAVGLGVTGRIGVNPGELLDFLLGFSGVDIYHDDLSKRPKRPVPARDAPAGPDSQ